MTLKFQPDDTAAITGNIELSGGYNAASLFHAAWSVSHQIDDAAWNASWNDTRIAVGVITDNGASTIVDDLCWWP